jgi:CubicO group peptidase (beta-lactamase class C family)
MNTFFRKIALLLALVCLAGLGRAQSGFDKIDRWLEDNAKEMGGRAVLVIYKDGKLIYSKAENEMNARQKMAGKFIARRMGKTPNLEDYTITTRQPIASCSKWLSAALVMTFVDEGKLSLSDTVGKYLPVLSAHGKGDITIGQCLSHLTGIKEPPLKQSLGEMKNLNSMDEAIEKIAELPMEGKPGKVFHYSNAGLQIAGAVIEKINGKSFETLFAERIAQPLEMKNTDFGKEKVAMPAGGAGSTPADYLNFLIMILNKGSFNGTRILSEKSIAEMQVNRITPGVTIAYSPAEGGGIGYGYGEWVSEDPDGVKLGRSVSSPGLFGSFPLVDKEKNYCAFLMVFNLQRKGNQVRYKALKQLMDEAIK